MWRWLLPLAMVFVLLIGTVVLWRQSPGQVLVPSQSRGEALIGGDYQLIDSRGQPVASQDMLGKHQLVYFGYSYCPDICPMGLLTISEALKALGDKASRVTPVFITIDPKRDTPEHLANYMTSFDSRFLALTGSEAAVAQALKAYRVYAARSAASPAEDQEHYLMDHSSYIYLMDPEGRYVQHFRHDAPVDALVKAINVALSASAALRPSSPPDGRP